MTASHLEVKRWLTESFSCRKKKKNPPLTENTEKDSVSGSMRLSVETNVDL